MHNTLQQTNFKSTNQDELLQNNLPTELHPTRQWNQRSVSQCALWPSSGESSEFDILLLNQINTFVRQPYPSCKPAFFRLK